MKLGTIIGLRDNADNQKAAFGSATSRVATLARVSFGRVVDRKVTHLSGDFFDPPPSEQQNIILIETATLVSAEKLIESYERCNPQDAKIPFDWILDRITGSDSAVTDYIMEAPAKYPRCRLQITEKTLVEPV
jgi:hypothetical protein